MHILRDDGIRDSTYLLPGFLKESMGQIEVFRVKDDLCKINHREINPAAEDDGHGTRLRASEKKMADPPRFEHGFEAPQAPVISRLHYGSSERPTGHLDLIRTVHTLLV